MKPLAIPGRVGVFLIIFSVVSLFGWNYLDWNFVDPYFSTLIFFAGPFFVGMGLAKPVLLRRIAAEEDGVTITRLYLNE
jgi:hypothetical protein